MTDPTNDIDALLRDLGYAASIGHQAWRHAALTALIAERDALRKRVAEQDADIKALAASNAILHGRLEAHPPADRDRELRERLIESALRGAGCSSLCDDAGAKALGRQAVWMVDGALAAMRKGESDEK